MHLEVENLNWFGAMRKLMYDPFQGDFRFLSRCLLVKRKMSNFSAFRFIIQVTRLDRSEENEKNETFPVSEGLSMKRNWKSKFGLIGAAHA